MVWIQANSSEKDVNENNQVDRYWSSLCDRSLSFHVNVRIQTLTSLLMHKDSCHFWKCGLQSFIESMVCLRMSSIFILQQDQTLYEVFYSCIKLLPNSSLFMKERNVVWISVVFYFQYSRCSMSGNFDRALIWSRHALVLIRDRSPYTWFHFSFPQAFRNCQLVQSLNIIYCSCLVFVPIGNSVSKSDKNTIKKVGGRKTALGRLICLQQTFFIFTYFREKRNIWHRIITQSFINSVTNSFTNSRPCNLT